MESLKLLLDDDDDDDNNNVVFRADARKAFRGTRWRGWLTLLSGP